LQASIDLDIADINSFSMDEWREINVNNAYTGGTVAMGNVTMQFGDSADVLFGQMIQVSDDGEGRAGLESAYLGDVSMVAGDGGRDSSHDLYYYGYVWTNGGDIEEVWVGDVSISAGDSRDYAWTTVDVWTSDPSDSIGEVHFGNVSVSMGDDCDWGAAYAYVSAGQDSAIGDVTVNSDTFSAGDGLYWGSASVDIEAHAGSVIGDVCVGNVSFIAGNESSGAAYFWVQAATDATIGDVDLEGMYTVGGSSDWDWVSLDMDISAHGGDIGHVHLGDLVATLGDGAYGYVYSSFHVDNGGSIASIEVDSIALSAGDNTDWVSADFYVSANTEGTVGDVVLGDVSLEVGNGGEGGGIYISADVYDN